MSTQKLPHFNLSKDGASTPWLKPGAPAPLGLAGRDVAYISNYRRTCEWPHCHKGVTTCVHNRWNEIIGYYCAPHAKARLKEQLRAEKG